MRRSAAVIFAVVLVGCGGESPTPTLPSPSPSPTATPGLPGVTVGASTGPTAITLLAADPPPGSTVSPGCGSGASGCTDRIRMTFRLTPTGSGPVLWCVGFLHADNMTACLQGRTAGLTLRAGEPQTIEVVFDTADTSGRCATPVEITHLALTVEGVVDVGSRQEWALGYRLAR
jgi:hypothetical protein